MDRKGERVFRSSFPLLLIAGCVWVFEISPVRAQLADGTWTV
jgi:hypothetical protein